MAVRVLTSLLTVIAGFLRRFLKNRLGVGAVELAILMPFLILLLFAIVEFGFIMYTRQNMLYAAREAARSYAVGRNDAPAARGLALRLLQVADEQRAKYKVTVIEPGGKQAGGDKKQGKEGGEGKKKGKEGGEGGKGDGKSGDVTVIISIPMATAALVNPLGDIIKGDLKARVTMFVEEDSEGGEGGEGKKEKKGKEGGEGDDDKSGKEGGEDGDDKGGKEGGEDGDDKGGADTGSSRTAPRAPLGAPGAPAQRTPRLAAP